MASDSINQISVKLLLAVKKQEPANTLLAELGSLPLSQILKELKNDDFKKVFWINV